MKILLLEENIPKKASSGGHVATFGLIDFLRAQGDLHIVNVISIPTLDPLEGPDVTLFRRQESESFWSRIAVLWAKDPKMVMEIDWPALEALIASHNAERIIYGSARFLHLSPANNRYYIADNVEFELVKAMTSNYRSPGLAYLDSERVERLEKQGIAKVHRAAAFTPRDAQQLSQMSGRPVEAIPPVLQPAYRPPVSRERFAFYPTNLDHPPNVDAMKWLVKEVWPLKQTDWNLVVTGAGDFSACAAEAKDIDFRGFVSREELADLYDRAGVVLNPTRTGSGFQIKLLEALSYGCPVVSTDFSNPIGTEIASSDDPARFAALVDAALASEEIKPFDYARFYQETVAKLRAFLELP